MHPPPCNTVNISVVKGQIIGAGISFFRLAIATLTAPATAEVREAIPEKKGFINDLVLLNPNTSN